MKFKIIFYYFIIILLFIAAVLIYLTGVSWNSMLAGFIQYEAVTYKEPIRTGFFFLTAVACAGLSLFIYRFPKLLSYQLRLIVSVIPMLFFCVISYFLTESIRVGVFFGGMWRDRLFYEEKLLDFIVTPDYLDVEAEYPSRFFWKINGKTIMMPLLPLPLDDKKVRELFNEQKTNRILSGIDEYGRTSLMRAANRGDSGTVQFIIKYDPYISCEISLKDKYGFTALDHACSYSWTIDTTDTLASYYNSTRKQESARLKVVKYILDSGVKDLNRALYLSSRDGFSSIVEYLISKGADVNSASADGDTPLLAASRYGRIDAVRILISYGASVNLTDEYGENALMKVIDSANPNNGPCWAGDDDVCKIGRLLIRNGIDINKSNYIGETALYKAADAGLTGTAALLIRKGADVNLTNKDGDSPVIRAALDGHADIVRMLIDNGADIHIKEEGALFAASYNDHPDSVKVLIRKGAVADGRILREACFKDGPETIGLLLDAGADVTNRGEDGETALMVYSGYNEYRADEKYHKAYLEVFDRNNTEPISIMVRHGADINTVDKNGTSALMAACCGGFSNIVNALIKNGADLNIRNKKGRTALKYAQDNGYTNIINLLINSGAKE